MPTLRFAATLLAALCWAPVGFAQDSTQDKDPKKPAPADPAAKADAPKGDKDKEKDKEKPAAKPAGEVEDKALDDLLKDIGDQDKDKPPPPKRPGAGEPPPAPPTRPGEPKADQVGEKEKPLDEHLEELQGRKKKKKDGQPQEEEGSGKLGEAIKKMREVEERLKKPDTGEETRKKQGEIVQDLDTLLKQLRQAQGQGKGRMMRGVQQAGNNPQPGQPGNQGNTAKGVGPMPPAKPTTTHALVGDKNEWGHLPPELRTEMENVSKEDGLPSRKDLIEKYYLTLSRKKGRTRGE